MLVGNMPSARSQLLVNRPFVLRQLKRGCGPEDLRRTLMADQLERANRTLNEQLTEQCGSGSASLVLMAAAQRAAEIVKTLGGGDELGGLRVSVNPKQRKALEKELGALQHPNPSPSPSPCPTPNPNPNPNPNPDPDPKPKPSP